MVADVGEKIVLITYPGEEQDAAVRLARIGSDGAAGYLNVDRDGVFPAELAELIGPRPGRRSTSSTICSPPMQSPSSISAIPVNGNPAPSPVRYRSRWRNCVSAWTRFLPESRSWCTAPADGVRAWRRHCCAPTASTTSADLLGGYNAWAEAHVPA